MAAIHDTAYPRLKYNIGDIEIREMIQAATCKSEEFNHFIKWVFFFKQWRNSRKSTS